MLDSDEGSVISARRSLDDSKDMFRKPDLEDVSEKDSHSKNRGGKKQTNNKVLRSRIHLVSRMSSYFPTGGHSVT